MHLIRCMNRLLFLANSSQFLVKLLNFGFGGLEAGALKQFFIYHVIASSRSCQIVATNVEFLGNL